MRFRQRRKKKKNHKFEQVLNVECVLKKSVAKKIINNNK